MTATGREAARSLYGEFATLAFLPYDLPWAVRRFVAHFRPRARRPHGDRDLAEPGARVPRGGRAAAARERAAVGEVGARLRCASGSLARAALGDLAAIGAQTAADAERLAALGAPASRSPAT